MKQKKEIVSIKNYQKLAMRTCMKSCRNKYYALYGFYSEKYELLAKINGYKAKKIRGDKDLSYEPIWQEIGDCFWFLALKCQLNKTSFEKLYKAKRPYVNSEIKRDEYPIIEGIDTMKSLCKSYNTTPLKCMQMNFDKLASRKARGKITGNGDFRQTYLKCRKCRKCRKEQK